MADVFHLGVGDCRVEFEEDDVDDWHYGALKWVVVVLLLGSWMWWGGRMLFLFSGQSYAFL